MTVARPAAIEPLMLLSIAAGIGPRPIHFSSTTGILWYLFLTDFYALSLLHFSLPHFQRPGVWTCHLELASEIVQQSGTICGLDSKRCGYVYIRPVA